VKAEMRLNVTTTKKRVKSFGQEQSRKISARVDKRGLVKNYVALSLISPVSAIVLVGDILLT
jgi:hypothetical protein